MNHQGRQVVVIHSPVYLNECRFFSMLRRVSGGAASAFAIDEKAKEDVQCGIKYDTLISTNENNTHSLTPQKSACGAIHVVAGATINVRR